MSLVRAVAFLLTAFGLLCGIALIVIGVAIWPPGIVLVFAAIWYAVHTYRQAKKETAMRLRIQQRIERERQVSEIHKENERRLYRDGFNPDLPSALD